MEQMPASSLWRTPCQISCDPVGSLCWSRLLEGPVEGGAHAGAALLVGLVGSPCCSSLFLKDGTPWKGPTLEQFMTNCSPWGGLTLEKLMEDCFPWEGPHAGAGEECEEFSP